MEEGARDEPAVASTVFEEKKTRKRVLTPKGKPVPKDKDSYVTPKGADIEVVFDKRFGLYMVNFPSGGKVPKELSGKWTEESRLRVAIESYLAKKR